MASYVDTFASTVPNTGTARHARTDIVNPDDPSAKPPAVRRIVVKFAPGTRIDTTAVPRCTATDAQLAIEGPAGCPQDSAIGSGGIDLDTGMGEPYRYLNEDSYVFNAADEVIVVTHDHMTGVYAPVRGKIVDNTIDISVPPLPGTPPDGAAVTFEDVTFDDVSSVRNDRRVHYLTTPPKCPASGAWTNRVTDTFADGVTQSYTTTTPCS